MISVILFAASAKTLRCFFFVLTFDMASSMAFRPLIIRFFLVACNYSWNPLKNLLSGGKNNKNVILFPLGKWKFFDHVEGGGNPVQDWYGKDLSEEGRFQFDSLLKACRKTADHRQWLGFKRFLKGAPKGVKVWELVFKADRREYRVMGMFTGAQREALILLGCYHKEKNYTPTNAIETAFSRAQMQLEGKATRHERQISDDL